MKICIVSSCGGHLTEVRCLSKAYGRYEHFYVLNDKAILPQEMVGITYFIRHSERDLNFFVNLYEAFAILLREKPNIILSSGAGPIVPFAILTRLFFFKTKIIFVETITRVHNPSLTGRIMYFLAHDFYYQWESLKACFPNGKFVGPII